jgi:hypothetical protein
MQDMKDYRSKKNAAEVSSMMNTGAASLVDIRELTKAGESILRIS